MDGMHLLKPNYHNQVLIRWFEELFFKLLKNEGAIAKSLFGLHDIRPTHEPNVKTREAPADRRTGT